MLLHYSPASPFARKCRILLHEKGIAVELHDGLSDGNAAAARVNPLGKIPVLIRDDGSALYDSPVIAEWIDGAFPDPPMIPSDFEARIEVKRWEALADGLADAAVSCVMESRRPAELRHAPSVDKQLGKLHAALAAFEAALAPGTDTLHPSGFGLAEAAVISAVGYLDFRLPDARGEAYVALDRYLARHAQRPSIAATVPR